MKRILLVASIALAATPALAGSPDSSGDPLVGFVMLLVLLGLVLGGYFLPTIIAYHRKHPNVAGIPLLNLFLGWTLIGWVGALVWSVMSLTTRERVIYVERESQQRPPGYWS